MYFYLKNINNPNKFFFYKYIYIYDVKMFEKYIYTYIFVSKFLFKKGLGIISCKNVGFQIFY
jgi:hypothetical protein